MISPRSEPRDVEPLPSLASPTPEHRTTGATSIVAPPSPVRVIVFPEDGVRGAEKAMMQTPRPLYDECHSSAETIAAAEPPRQPVEEPPQLRTHRVINWGTTCGPGGGRARALDPGHQADEGAGMTNLQQGHPPLLLANAASQGNTNMAS